MALTATNVTRTDDTSGDLFLTFDTPGGDKAQGVAVIDASGNPIGFTGSPIVTSITGSVSVNLAASGTPWAYNTAGTAENVVQLYNAAADLRELRVILDPATPSDRYLMLFDVGSAPVNGAVPTWRALIPGGGEASESFPADLPFSFSNTLYVGVSSTPDTLTITSGEAYYHARGLV